MQCRHRVTRGVGFEDVCFGVCVEEEFDGCEGGGANGIGELGEELRLINCAKENVNGGWGWKKRENKQGRG